MNMLQQSRNQVLAQIQSACALAGREPDSVQLLAVSKTQPSPVLAEMYQAGQRAFGENYLQEVLEKINDILRQKAAYERLQAKAAVNEEDAIQNEEDIERKLVIPELTDEVAVSLGQPGQFTGVDDLKTKLKEHLEIEKKNENIAKHRGELTDKIVDVTEIALLKLS